MVRWGICGVLVALACATASAREWTTRNGQDLGEGKLLDADEEAATIRFDQTGVQRVPLARLSLEDLMFVREARAAAQPAGPAGAPTSVVPAPPAMGTPPVGAAAPTAEPSPNADAPSAEASATDASSAFPLTRPNSTDWQVRPDPPAFAWSAEDLARAVSSPLPATAQRPASIVLPEQPSRYVAICNNRSSDVWDLWDLTTAQRVGAVRGGGEADSGLQAISADGRYFAAGERHRPSLTIWDLEQGHETRTVPLGDNARSEKLYWGAEGQLFAASSYNSGARVINAATGQVTPVALASSRSSAYDLWTTTPGGHYAVNVAPSHDRIEFYDLRNGALAGDVLLPGSDLQHGEMQQLGFSADGGELVAWAVDRGSERSGRLMRWNLTTGQLVENTTYKLPSPDFGNITLGSRGRSGVAIGPALDQWLVAGSLLLDAELKRPVWSYSRAGQPRRRNILRVLGGTHMLTDGAAPDQPALAIRPLPKEEIAKSREIVAAGGTPDDVSLPKLTAADFGDVPRRSPFPASDRPYEPEAAAPLPDEMSSRWRFSITLNDRAAGDPSEVAFARAAPNVAIGLTHLDAGQLQVLPPDAPERRLPHRLDVLDLTAGQRTANWSIPAALAMIGASPAGDRVLVKSTDDDRFDVYDVADGKHVVGFRPFETASGRLANPWGALIDENHALLAQRMGELALWSLKPCRLIYSRAMQPLATLALAPDGQYMAVRSGASILIVETMTGETVVELPFAVVDQDATLTSLAFSPDGRRLAGLVTLRTGAARLLVWDIAAKRVTSDLHLAVRMGIAGWAGDDVLLTSVPHGELTQSAEAPPAGPGDPRSQYYYEQQQLLRQGNWGAVRIDLQRGEAVWSYQLEGCRRIDDGPGGRSWFLCRRTSERAALFSLGERTADEQRVLAEIAPPQRVEIPGASIAVHVDVGPLPLFVGRNEQRREEFARVLKEHFTEVMKGQTFTGPEGADRKLKVVLREQRGEDLPQVWPPRGDVRRGAGAWANLTIVDSRRTLWEAEQWFAAGYQETGMAPQPQHAIRYMAAWEKAMEWALAQGPPRDLQATKSVQGFGHSRLGEEGLVIVRQWSRAEQDQDAETLPNSQDGG